MNAKGKVAPTLGTTTNYYWCCLYKKELAKRQGAGYNMKGKTLRMPVACGMKLKDVVNNATGWHTISLHKNGDCIEYNYSLSLSDQIKRNSALKTVASAEVVNGYSFVAVTATMRAPGGSRLAVKKALQEAGGLYLTRDDMKNAGKQWSKENLDTRFVSADFLIEVQMFEAKEWLQSQGYKAECLTATRELDGLPSLRLIFVAEHWLQTLRERG